MLIERGRDELVALCEICETASAPMESREIAILRLLRAQWRVRTAEGITRTWCPLCQTAPSVPSIKVES